MPPYTGWYRTAAASSDETVRTSGSKTGHWPRWPSSVAAYHRPRNWPPPAALSGCPPIRPPHDRRPDLLRHRAGRLRPRQIGVCAGGQQAGLPGMRRAAEVRGWLRAATRRAEPLRAAATVGAYAGCPSRGGTPPLADAVEAMDNSPPRTLGGLSRRCPPGERAEAPHPRTPPAVRSRWATLDPRGSLGGSHPIVMVCHSIFRAV